MELLCEDNLVPNSHYCLFILMRRSNSQSTLSNMVSYAAPIILPHPHASFPPVVISHWFIPTCRLQCWLWSVLWLLTLPGPPLISAPQFHIIIHCPGTSSSLLHVVILPVPLWDVLPPFWEAFLPPQPANTVFEQIHIISANHHVCAFLCIPSIS